MDGPVMMMTMITSAIGNIDGIAYAIPQIIARVIAQVKIVRLLGSVYHSVDVRVIDALIVMSAMIAVQSIPYIHIRRFFRFVVQLIDSVHLQALILCFAAITT